jgi:hypothetical protein
MTAKPLNPIKDYLLLPKTMKVSLEKHLSNMARVASLYLWMTNFVAAQGIIKTE